MRVPNTSQMNTSAHETNKLDSLFLQERKELSGCSGTGCATLKVIEVQSSNKVRLGFWTPRAFARRINMHKPHFVWPIAASCLFLTATLSAAEPSTPPPAEKDATASNED